MQLVGAPEQIFEQVLRAREREQVAERVDPVRSDEARVLAPERAVGKRLEARGLEHRVVALAEQRREIGVLARDLRLEPGRRVGERPYTSALMPCWMSERVGSQTVFAKFFTASQIFQDR